MEGLVEVEGAVEVEGLVELDGWVGCEGLVEVEGCRVEVEGAAEVEGEAVVVSEVVVGARAGGEGWSGGLPELSRPNQDSVFTWEMPGSLGLSTGAWEVVRGEWGPAKER